MLSSKLVQRIFFFFLLELLQNMIQLLSKEGSEALPVCFKDFDVEYAWPMEN